MGVKHGFVNTRVVALGAFKRLGAKVVTKMILKVMLVFCDKWALRALKQLVLLDMCT